MCDALVWRCFCARSGLADELTHVMQLMGQLMAYWQHQLNLQGQGTKAIEHSRHSYPQICRTVALVQADSRQDAGQHSPSDSPVGKAESIPSQGEWADATARPEIAGIWEFPEAGCRWYVSDSLSLSISRSASSRRR